MKHFQSAAVNTMGQTNPGFSDFMNGVMNNEPKIDSRGGGGGPPPPTQNYETSSTRYGNNEYGSNKSSIRPTNTSKQNDNDGINIRENKGNRNNNNINEQSRVEMKGPSDISDLLSRLKTKTINIQEQNNNSNNDNGNINDSSTISISELKELQGDGVIPKRSNRRRQKSDKNTLSLDI
jgi:hypothetical protein